MAWFATGFVAGAVLFAQETQYPAPPVVPLQPSVNNFTWRGVKLTGVLDGYYAFNSNHPESGRNSLRSFDTEANTFDLNMLKFGVEKSAEPVGFRLDLGVGRAFDVFQAFEPTRRVEQLNPVMQAYLSVKPKSWGGLQLDFGKFFTSACVEVTDAQANWNYSRSILYQYGTFFHFGVRATKPIGRNFTAGVQIVNGWNNVADNNNGKTLGLTGLWTKGRVTWANNYYAGPEKNHTNQGIRHFFDTALTVNTSDNNSFYVNFDWAVDRGIREPGRKFLGVAVADRYGLSKKFALSPRVEWYNDAQGFSTGTVQQVKEFTLTGEYKFMDGLLTRAEFRRDWSNTPFFDQRAGLPLKKSQNTFVLGFVSYFGPKS